MTSKGAVLIAKNNGELDYVKQSVFLAKRIKKYLNIPVSVITDSADYLKNSFDSTVFDQIIPIEYTNDYNNRRYYDGTLYNTIGSFKNSQRSIVYHLSPYDETILMDTDYIVCNDKLNRCFSTNSDLMLFKKSVDLSIDRNTDEFLKVSDTSIDFYWATVVYFKKSNKNEIFFNLIDHIQENWSFYQKRYYINESMFRNDYAFSIAVHMLNGFELNNSVVTEIPTTHYYIIDKDLLSDIQGDCMKFLIQKKDYLGEYTLAKTKGLNVHVMNKFSLERVINKETEIE
jgi:hypothetical protein